MAFSQVLDGKVPFTLSGELDAAVAAAHEQAWADGLPQPVVALSPACASFDQFSSFEARGDVFKNLVEALPGDHLDPFEEPGIFPGTIGSEGMMGAET